jgi:hypothetical protein
MQEEAEALFTENPQLQPNLERLKAVITRVTHTIKTNDNVHVSFGVYEAFNSLANSDVRQYRSLEVLKGVKSSF